MEPLIRPGDQVLISRLSADKIRRGDIIVFRSGDGLIAHRVLKRCLTSEGICFREKGDRERTWQMVRANAVIGVAINISGRSRIIDIGSSFSRLIAMFLAVILYWIAGGIDYLTQSRNGTKNNTNSRLSLLLFMFSRALIRMYFLAWYPSVLFFRKKGSQGELESRENHPREQIIR